MHLQDPRLEVLPCMHSGTYADDCICERIRQHKCYIVATCDRDLRRRIRKVLLPLCRCHVCDFCCSNVGMRLPSIAEHHAVLETLTFLASVARLNAHAKHVLVPTGARSAHHVHRAAQVHD